MTVILAAAVCLKCGAPVVVDRVGTTTKLLERRSGRLAAHDCRLPKNAPCAKSAAAGAK